MIEFVSVCLILFICACWQLRAASGAARPPTSGNSASALDDVELRRLLETLPLVPWEADADTWQVRYVGPQAVHLLGHPIETWFEKNFWSNHIHPDDLARIMPLCRAATARGESHEFQYRIRAADGRYVWVHDRVAVILDERGRPARLRGALIDITEQKLAEQRATVTEHHFQSIFRNMLDAVLFTDDQRRYVEVNPAACRLLGMTREQLLAHRIDDLSPHVTRDELETLWREFIARGEGAGVYKIRHSDGSILDIEYVAKANIVPGRHISILRDVTDRIRFEREREQLISDLNERVKELTALHDAARILQRSDEDIEAPLRDLLRPLTKAWRCDGAGVRIVLPDRAIATRDFTETPWMLSVDIPLPHHAIGQIDVAYASDCTDEHGCLFLDEEQNLLNSVAQMVGNYLDRRKAERSLRDSEEQARAFFDASSLYMSVIELDGDTLRYVSVNRSYADFYQLPPEDFPGRDLAEIGVPPERLTMWRKQCREATRLKSSINFEYSIDLPDRRIWLSAHLCPIGKKQGPRRFACIIEDITERYEAEERRRLMARELDHRVKNNLAIVGALADQTMGHCSSLDEFRAAFNGRLRALARSHELISTSQWRGASLHALTHDLLQEFRFTSDPIIDIVGDDASLSAREASSVALIVHELLTNAVKHGALASTAGRVVIESEVTRQPRPELTLRWTEHGGPEVIPPSSNGLGMELIRQSVTFTLGGRIQLELPPSGLSCTVTFPLQDPDARPPELDA